MSALVRGGRDFLSFVDSGDTLVRIGVVLGRMSVVDDLDRINIRLYVEVRLDIEHVHVKLLLTFPFGCGIILFPLLASLEGLILQVSPIVLRASSI
mmetsp:Transcript_15948/g.15355  ORF Transcript_15948/g.15355 Transcript_15948/m.15355 type:complete len:96 (-) Transcript_15948:433-720(-)